MAKDALRFLGDHDSSVNCTCDILDKDLGRFQYVQYMFDRTNRMFRYTGLPETIPEYMLEYMLQIFGSVAIISHNDSLYALRANFGGPPDPYYRPTQAVIANPALNITTNYKIVNYLPPFDTIQWTKLPEAVRFINDTQIMGLLPLFSRYASQLTENDISIRCAQINLRQQTVIAADSGADIESAHKYIEDLELGKLSAIAKRPFLDGVSVTNASMGQSNIIIQLIELQQYLKASWYNDIGLNSNFNMKRQYISSDEVNSTADIMLPLIDNMFECRKEAVSEINKHFGTNITVEKDSAWAKKQIQSDLSIVPEEGDDSVQNEGSLTISDTPQVEPQGEPETKAQQTVSSQLDSDGEPSQRDSNTENKTVEESSEENQEEVEEGGDRGDVNVEVNVNINTEEGAKDEEES